MPNQKVFAPIVIVVIAVAAVAVGVYFYWQKTEIKVEVSPSPTISSSAFPNPSVSTLETNETISMISGGYLYVNNIYNFQLTFSGVWEGLTTRYISEPSYSTRSSVDTIYFQVPLSTCNKTPNPTTGDCYTAPLAINIYTLAAWEKLKAEPTGTYIAKNNQYVFSYRPWQEPDAGMENFDFQFSKVTSTFKFTK